MNNYLLQLLKEVKTIIIPGLGALTLTNEATGEMMFMSYLKFDDGTLAKHIAEKEGIELNDASNTIAKFVREVQAEIDKGNSYDMYQFGSFRKEGGETVFTQWSAGSTATVQQAIPTKTEDTPAENAESGNEPGEAVVDPQIISFAEEKNPPENTNDTAAEISGNIVTEEKQPEIPTPSVTSEEPEIALTPSGFDTEHAEPVKEEKHVEEIHASPLPVNDVPDEVKHDAGVPPSPKDIVIEQDRKASNKDNSPLAEEKKKKTSAFVYILWGIVVLILGAATYVAVNYESMKAKYPILAELAGEDTLNVTRTESALQPDDTLLAENQEPLAPDTAREPEPIDESMTEETAPAVPKTIAVPKPVTPAKPVAAAKPAQPVIAQPAVKKPVAVAKPAIAVTPVAQPSRKPASRPRNSANVAVSIAKPDPSKPFHVIGGSFSSEVNAKSFARTMIEKGAKCSVLTETNGMFRVSLAAFGSKEEAVDALGYLHAFVPSAWVLKWP